MTPKKPDDLQSQIQQIQGTFTEHPPQTDHYTKRI